MRYLFKHYNTFYFKKKIHNNTICISLRTNSEEEAKYILSIITPKIGLMGFKMTSEEEVEYIKKIIKKYIEAARDEYSEFAYKREQKYKMTKKSGNEILGSHPKAIKTALKTLQDAVFSTKKEDVAKEIIQDSNISKEEFMRAFKELSTTGKQRFLDEIIKAEMEILYFDKQRNEQRTLINDFRPTYIEDIIQKPSSSSNNNISALDLVKTIKEEEQNEYKTKTLKEICEEYLKQEEEDKHNFMDKIKPPLITLQQAAEDKEYLVDYNLEDFERFFNALIYTPRKIALKKKLFEDYNGNYVVIAEAFKEYVIEGENVFFDEYNYEFQLQSVKNVKEKLYNVNSFFKWCHKNKYIKENYFENNSKFSNKRFEKILKASKERDEFTAEEINNIFESLVAYIEIMGFSESEIYVTLLGFFTGMRVEEICKLKTEDIKNENGIYYIDINGEVKTEDSIRKVPIHDFLINKFYFLKYVEKREEAKEEQLFEFKPIQHKNKLKYSHYFLRDFFSHIRNEVVAEERIEENLISFHSFRHSFATRLIHNDVNPMLVSQLLGHKLDAVIKKMLEDSIIVQNETQRYTKKEKRLVVLQHGVNNLYTKDVLQSIDLLAEKVKENI